MSWLLSNASNIVSHQINKHKFIFLIVIFMNLNLVVASFFNLCIFLLIYFILYSIQVLQLFKLYSNFFLFSHWFLLYMILFPSLLNFRKYFRLTFYFQSLNLKNQYFLHRLGFHFIGRWNLKDRYSYCPFSFLMVFRHFCRTKQGLTAQVNIFIISLCLNIFFNSEKPILPQGDTYLLLQSSRTNRAVKSIFSD